MLQGLLTISLDHIVWQQEGEGCEEQPDEHLEQVVSVVQVLVTLVALVLDADQRQGQRAEEQLQGVKNRQGGLLEHLRDADWGCALITAVRYCSVAPLTQLPKLTR